MKNKYLFSATSFGRRCIRLETLLIYIILISVAIYINQDAKEIFSKIGIVLSVVAVVFLVIGILAQFALFKRKFTLDEVIEFFKSVFEITLDGLIYAIFFFAPKHSLFLWRVFPISFSDNEKNETYLGEVAMRAAIISTRKDARSVKELKELSYYLNILIAKRRTTMET